MADKKNQAKTAKNAKSEATGKKNSEEKKANVPYLYIAIGIIVIVGLFLLIKGPTGGASVPFSTFKSTFQSAPRVGIVATFSNQNQYENESPCFTSLIQVVARTRKASTIDFFIVNQANATRYWFDVPFIAMATLFALPIAYAASERDALAFAEAAAE